MFRTTCSSEEHHAHIRQSVPRPHYFVPLAPESSCSPLSSPLTSMTPEDGAEASVRHRFLLSSHARNTGGRRAYEHRRARAPHAPSSPSGRTIYEKSTRTRLLRPAKHPVRPTAGYRCIMIDVRAVHFFVRYSTSFCALLGGAWTEIICQAKLYIAAHPGR